MRLKPHDYREYLNAILSGKTVNDATKIYGVSITTIRLGVLTEANKLGRSGFWKFHCHSVAEVVMMKNRLRELML